MASERLEAALDYLVEQASRAVGDKDASRVREAAADVRREAEAGADPDLRERLGRAVDRLEGLRAEARGFHEHARLGGKVDGVKLALSYVREAG